MKKKMIEINGKRYVTAGVFSDNCDMNTQKVVAACKDGRVLGACKDSSGRWIIPTETYKPLETEYIRKVLVIVLYLKNWPEKEIDLSQYGNIVNLFIYLSKTGYIEEFDVNCERIPHEAILTEKGMALATKGEKLDFDWLRDSSMIIQTVAALLTFVKMVL